MENNIEKDETDIIDTLTDSNFLSILGIDDIMFSD